jgi:hypothetical protein
MVISFYFGTQTEKNKANEEYLEDKLNKQWYNINEGSPNLPSIIY